MLRVRTGQLCAALVVLTIAAYLPVWNNGLVNFDDELYISRNPYVLRGLTGEGFVWAWTNVDAKYWQPISWLSLQLDAHLFSSQSPLEPPVVSPAAFHGQSLFWHTASALLLFALCLRLTAARWCSFLVAALFALHPLHVESVAWGAERKDVLSVFFGLLTLWAYVGYVEKRSGRRYLAVVVAYALSLLSKPTLTTLPFVLLLLDYWPLRRLGPATSARGLAATAGRLILEKLPLFVLAALIGLVTMLTRGRAGAVVSLGDLPLSARLANAATAYGGYLSATFFPTRLAVLYPHPSRDWSVPATVAGTTTLVVLTVLAVWQVRRRPWLIVGWLWFVGTLVPVIGLAQGGVQAWADRFCYFPHIGLVLAVVWGLAELIERLRLPALVPGMAATVALGCLGVLTWVQVGYWRDTVTLWEHALAVTRNNHRAHMYLGRHWEDNGRFDQAEAQYAEAVRIHPRTPTYRYNLGGVQFELWKLEEAAEQFQKALEVEPENAAAWHNLGTIRLRQGNLEGAVGCFRKVLDLRPESSDSLAGMGLALWQQGKQQEAIRSFEAALELNPREPQAWCGLGKAYLAQGRHREAIEALSRAVQIQPGLVNAHYELGIARGRAGNWEEAYLSEGTAVYLQEQGEARLKQMNGRVLTQDSLTPSVLFRCRLAFTLDQHGDTVNAEAEYRRALAQDPHWPEKLRVRAATLLAGTNPPSRDTRLAYELVSQAARAVPDPPATLLDTLATAQAAVGMYQEAAQTVKRALNKLSGEGETPFVRSLRARQQLYEQGKPAPPPSPNVH
jgi:tetratricopeptide (TPR) repeat protein